MTTRFSRQDLYNLLWTERADEVAKPGRRRFTTAYIDAVLKELDAARHGEIGKILRCEGLSAKQVALWRKQRESGVQPKRRPKPAASSEVRKELARLARENARLVRKLEQAEMIIDVQKKVAALTECDGHERRAALMGHVTQLREHVGVRRACDSLDLARSTYYARQRPRMRIPMPAQPRPRPVRALSEEQRNEALELLTSEAFVDKAPASIVASLLDQGRYVCSPRTFYRCGPEGTR